VFGVSAGAGLFRRDLFAKIGLLDERFHAYFEDSDLCFRARLAGFRARLVPEAVACHIGSASIEGRTWWRARQCFRNHALLVAKNMPGRLLLRHGAAILKERGHQAGRLFSAARCEFGAIRACGIVVATCLSAWMAMPAMLAARRRIQRTRVLPDAAVDALLRTSYQKERN